MKILTPSLSKNIQFRDNNYKNFTELYWEIILSLTVACANNFRNRSELHNIYAAEFPDIKKYKSTVPRLFKIIQLFDL